VPLAPLPSRDLEVLPGRRELLVGAPVSLAVARAPSLVDHWTSLLPPR
jgi:hypothetical protein